MTMTIARIALAVPLYKTFDYLLAGFSPEIGARVRVPFGRQHKIGIVIELLSHSEVKPELLKSIEAVIDEHPLLPSNLFKLVQWASHYYHHPLGDALFTTIPTALRQGKAAQKSMEKIWTLTELGRSQTINSKRAPKQAALIAMLKSRPMSQPEIIRQGFNAAAIKAIKQNGWIAQAEPTCDKHWQKNYGICEEKPKLNQDQALTIATVKASTGFACYLLDGVTGSGKTEVYLNLLEAVLAQGRQALILVPEIGLTPQTVNRFKRRFKLPVSVLHSALNDTERLNAWVEARDNDAAIIIGTRSALFSPCLALGIIIVDEEHDISYKQQDSFRYHARDLAVMRAHAENIPIVLGSATPSFESLHNAQQGKYQHLHLHTRAGNAVAPKFGIQNMCGLHLSAGISAPLLAKMRQHLQQNNQVMLFLNRRGFAPVLMCHECGWTAQCNRCDTNYTLHQKSHELRCHHCSTQRALPKQCASCGSTQLIVIGTGTEQLETELASIFPEYKICRIDRDNTRRKGALEQFLTAINKKEYQILIGTQMLAKGHHFPNVTLVALVDVDGALFSQDFRAPERLAQLFIQVAGRAGRASKPGEVLLQTHHPEHPLLQALVHQGYAQFAKQNLQERQQTNLPPYSLFCLFRAESHQSELAEQFLIEVSNHFKGLEQASDELLCIGPLPSAMHKRAGKYRWQLVLQAQNRKQLQQALYLALPSIQRLPLCKKIRWSIDIEPQDMN